MRFTGRWGYEFSHKLLGLYLLQEGSILAGKI